jgi:hypothetical protein
MAEPEFDFIEIYRRMVPSASREVVAAREKAHRDLFPEVKTTERVYALCRLAFELPEEPNAIAEWFEKPIKNSDPHFSIKIDIAEAGRIAGALLRHLIADNDLQAALCVLSVSYSGKRAPVDAGDLLEASRDAIVKAGKRRGMTFPSSKLAYPAGKPLDPEFAAIEGSFSGASVKAGIEAAVADLRGSSTRFAASANLAYQSLRNDAARLADEVDLLWWHLGDWSELLEKPRSQLLPPALALVCGADMGALVREMPGPYGAYGILRRTVGEFGDKTVRLDDAIDALDPIDIPRLACKLSPESSPVFPVHAAIKLATERGKGAWANAFYEVAKDLKNVVVTHFDLSVQIYRERLLIVHGGLA